MLDDVQNVQMSWDRWFKNVSLPRGPNKREKLC